MKKKRIVSGDAILIITVIAIIALTIASLFISKSDRRDTDRAQLEEMQIYHSSKGLVEINDGRLIIRK